MFEQAKVVILPAALFLALLVIVVAIAWRLRRRPIHLEPAQRVPAPQARQSPEARVIRIPGAAEALTALERGSMFPDYWLAVLIIHGFAARDRDSFRQNAERARTKGYALRARHITAKMELDTRLWPSLRVHPGELQELEWLLERLPHAQAERNYASVKRRAQAAFDALITLSALKNLRDKAIEPDMWRALSSTVLRIEAERDHLLETLSQAQIALDEIGITRDALDELVKEASRAAAEKLAERVVERSLEGARAACTLQQLLLARPQILQRELSGTEREAIDLRMDRKRFFESLGNLQRHVGRVGDYLVITSMKPPPAKLSDAELGSLLGSALDRELGLLAEGAGTHCGVDVPVELYAGIAAMSEGKLADYVERALAVRYAEKLFDSVTGIALSYQRAAPQEPLLRQIIDDIPMIAESMSGILTRLAQER